MLQQDVLVIPNMPQLAIAVRRLVVARCLLASTMTKTLASSMRCTASRLHKQLSPHVTSPHLPHSMQIQLDPWIGRCIKKVCRRTGLALTCAAALVEYHGITKLDSTDVGRFLVATHPIEEEQIVMMWPPYRIMTFKEVARIVKANY